MRTQDLINKGESIEYVYNYNQLIETIYRKPQYEHKYKYGEPTDGNNAGRLIFRKMPQVCSSLSMENWAN